MAFANQKRVTVITQPIRNGIDLGEIDFEIILAPIWKGPNLT